MNRPADGSVRNSDAADWIEEPGNRRPQDSRPLQHHLSRAELQALLLQLGFELRPDAPCDDRNLVASLAGIRLAATLSRESREAPGRHACLRLMAWARRTGEPAHAVAAAFAHSLPGGHLGHDRDGDLVITQIVDLSPGVTTQFVRLLLEYWRVGLRRWADAEAH